jgi:hypothetical protein
MPDLSVKVDHHDIVVSKPSVGLSFTYRKQGRQDPLPGINLSAVGSVGM